MADQTAITWAEATHNPWIGCTRVSRACDSCYAAHLMETRMGRAVWGGPGKGAGTRVQTSEANRRKPLSWNRHPEKLKAPEGTKPFVFCSSLADVFDNEVDPEWRRELFEVIHATPNLQWLLLTKRPQLIERLWFKSDGSRPWPANAAIGTTVEDRERLPNLTHLADAAVEIAYYSGGQGPTFTFASFEPLLEDLGDLTQWMRPVLGRRLGWAITGGETDQGEGMARPVHDDAYRSIRDQAAAAGIPYQHKQNGEWVACPDNSGGAWPVDEPGFIRLNPDGSRTADGWPYQKVGKKFAGRLLDGVEHNERPLVPLVTA